VRSAGGGAGRKPSKIIAPGGTMKEHIVTVKYRFKFEGDDDLANKAAVLDYLGSQKYDDALGEYFGPGHNLKFEERAVEFEGEATEKQGFIVGKWFHTFKEIEGKRELCRQGQVLAIRSDFILVQIYEWGGGNPSCQMVVSLVDTKDWDFYSSNDEMLETYHSRYVRD
jgi:hypothetical protein